MGLQPKYLGLMTICSVNMILLSSDQYYAFNNAAVSVAKENPFNVAQHYVYGMPKDIKDNKTYLNLKKVSDTVFI